jgi:hypothetical protein
VLSAGTYVPPLRENAKIKKKKPRSAILASCPPQDVHLHALAATTDAGSGTGAKQGSTSSLRCPSVMIEGWVGAPPLSGCMGEYTAQATKAGSRYEPCVLCLGPCVLCLES